MRAPHAGRCPQCGAAIRREAQRFCTTCGAPLRAEVVSALTTQPPAAPPGAPSREAAPEEAVPARERRIVPGTPPLAPPQRTLRELYSELGSALLEAGRYAEAVEALERAANEPEVPGAEPTALSLQLQLAYASERAGDGDRALKRYLQTPLLAPESTLAVLDHAHTLLSAETALSLGRWIRERWKTEIEKAVAGAEERGAIALFEGHLHLFLAEYEQALDCFEQALRLAPERTRGTAPFILSPEHLPPALATLTDGSGHHMLARLYQTLSLHREAEEHARRALDLGVPGDDFPEAEVQQLLAEVLTELGSGEEAGEWLYEAGRRRLWRNDYPGALTLFEQALQHRPHHGLTHWQLMEMHRLASYLPDPPYADPESVAAALRAWEAGLRANGEEPDHAWVYVSRGLIAEQLARLDDGEAFHQRWDGVRLYLCALVLDPSDLYAWSYLGRNTRNLNLTACALWALGQVLDWNPDQELALEERVAIFGNLGRFTEAEEALDRLRELQPEATNDYFEALRAFIYLYSGRARETLPLVRPLVEKTPNEVWYRSMLAEAHERLGDEEAALQQHRWIHELCRETSSDSIYWARSALMLGQVEEARERYSQLAEDPSAPPGNGLRGVGFCHLILGEVEEGRKALSEGIALVHIGWLLDYLEQVELPHVRRAVAEAPHRPQVEQALGELAPQIEARRQALLAEERSPADELRPYLSHAESVVRVGARAGLARVLATEGGWREAGEQYLALMPDAPLFPQLGRALHETVDGLRTRAIEQLRAREPLLALREGLEPALEFERLAPLPSAPRQVELLALIAFAQLELAREEAAITALRGALALLSSPGSPARAGALADHWRELLRDAEHYWEMRERLASLARRPGLEEDLGEPLREASRALEEYLAQLLGMGAEAGENLRWSLSVPAILLHLGESLVNEGSAPLGERLQAMRERIQLEMGVAIPQVQYQMSGLDLEPAGYSISLEDVPRVTGWVRAGWPYTPAAAEQLRSHGIPAEGIEEVDPLTGLSGAWVAPEHRERIESLGLPIWEDPLRFVLAHLEVVLRRNLESFLGYEEALRLLEPWTGEPAVAAVLRHPPHEGAARLRVARLLRALLQEQVPITDLPAICGALEEGELLDQDPADALRRVRLQLRDRLPGNREEVAQILLPEELEARLATGVQRHGGRRFFALLPQEAQEVMSAVRALVEPARPRVALVTRRAELRPLLWRLLQYEFPEVPALSLEEASRAAPLPLLEAAREDAYAP